MLGLQVGGGELQVEVAHKTPLPGKPCRGLQVGIRGGSFSPSFFISMKGEGQSRGIEPDRNCSRLSHLLTIYSRFTHFYLSLFLYKSITYIRKTVSELVE